MNMSQPPLLAVDGSNRPPMAPPNNTAPHAASNTPNPKSHERRLTGRSMKIVSPSPESSTKRPSAVQWKSRNQIEEAELDIHQSQEASEHDEPLSRTEQATTPAASDGAERRHAPSAKLTTGPAIAIKNSAFGLGGSSLICATPPNKNNVIWPMGIR